ncbi:UNVERIFIED_CONTAM: UTP:RNA uridylyltransferase 1 [Sesamum calycinum]|uniref:UTP:RNA uridylyltransferase 1 n=1 Tax=Sesamum calycinum TaxID=2727403 RepID=A0AAW2SYV0_9LAMI
MNGRGGDAPRQWRGVPPPTPPKPTQLKPSYSSPLQQPPSQTFSQDPAVAAVGPTIPSFPLPHSAFPSNTHDFLYRPPNPSPSPPFAPHNYFQQNPNAKPNLNPDFSSPPGGFNYALHQFNLHSNRISPGDDTRKLVSYGDNSKSSVAHQQEQNIIFGSLNRDILHSDPGNALRQSLYRENRLGNSYQEEGLRMDRMLNGFPVNSIDINGSARGNSTILRAYEQKVSSNSDNRRKQVDNGSYRAVAPPPGFSTRSSLQSVSALDIEESMMELRGKDGENGEELICGGRDKMNRGQTEIDDLEDQLVGSLGLEDESGERSDKKKHHRDKDYRSDKRGQWIMGQRMRNVKRQMACRSDINSFNAPFLAVFESLIPADEEKVKQKQLMMLLEKHVSTEWPEAQLHVYGSCANSFGFSKSDIDVCLAMELDNIDKSEILLKLADILQSDNLQNVQALTRARVPIVKLKDPVTGISCDICVNNVLAVVNTKLLRDYARIDVRLRQLAFIIKHWAKSRGVNETYQGTLSSYARPAILPCLQGMEITYFTIVDNVECAYFDQVEKLQNFGLRNGESIAQLVWAFFHYWAYCHDYANDVISVRTGSTLSMPFHQNGVIIIASLVPSLGNSEGSVEPSIVFEIFVHFSVWHNKTSKRAKDWTRRVGNDRHLICIEDPFEVSHDLGRVVDKYSIRVLREEFERAAEIMQYDLAKNPRWKQAPRLLAAYLAILLGCIVLAPYYVEWTLG